ncbi:nucleostemin 3 isoform X2 [Rhynchophorus ferrugineus]|uniref:nucleostemin 3 isoform X2 n=1 Tax=Rhynchophorus ferrugineus TaxID=354439 RepID=UPI003FCCAB5A
MGKKNKQSGPSLGRALIKDRFGHHVGKKMVSNDSMLHTTELNDGYEWGRLNLQSVTEESSFQEFLSTAELAGTEFQAEKLNIKFINPQSNVGLLTHDEIKKVKDKHQKFQTSLTIPRRPPWTSDMTPSELDRNEKDNFLDWRRSLVSLQEIEGILLTPYEKNLEFWRQLWRVIERSDVVVQIVDGRNPLLFRCEDLEKYVKELSKDKINLILINKADYLTECQRKLWAKYFDSVNLRAIFYSALNEKVVSHTEEEDIPEENSPNVDKEVLKQDIIELEKAVEKKAIVLDNILSKIESMLSEENLVGGSDDHIQNSFELVSREQLIEIFRTIHKGSKFTEGITTIGLVGYPNVGKSSTINSLLCAKKVSVSATPGKTKHFQTLYLDSDILLCDCPGLVMPSFVFTKAEMILNGILPIDQMRDHVPPINLVTSLIPRHVIENRYGIMLPQPLEGEDPDRNPTAEELLNAYAYNRGFMTANGQPDNPRGARYILKDYMNGKLLYCHAPPDIRQAEYHIWPEKKPVNSVKMLPPRQARAIRNVARK